MSVRTSIQSKIIGALQNGRYPVVTYDAQFQPQETEQELSPDSVICNEVSLDFGQQLGASIDYVLSNWIFEATVKFSREVDLVDYLMTLNLTFGTADYAVFINVSSYCVIDQSPTQGSHTGTQMKIYFVANVKK